MRINEAEALSNFDILPHHIEQKRRFAGAGLADDVCVK
jgi:hypothetical protein